MSSDYDIEMGIDDTLEMDTIIKKSSLSKDPIQVKTSKKYNLYGFQTHTGVFDPQESGDHKLVVNGQSILINVIDNREIPDSIASRGPDDVKNTNSSKRGIKINTKSDWGSIGVEISSNTPNSSNGGPTEAQIIQLSDGQILQKVDISQLSGGDTFTFNSVGLISGNNYAIVAYDSGNSFTYGGDTNPSFEYTSQYVDIIDGIKQGTQSADPTNFSKVGNIGF